MVPGTMLSSESEYLSIIQSCHVSANQNYTPYSHRKQRNQKQQQQQQQQQSTLSTTNNNKNNPSNNNNSISVSISPKNTESTSPSPYSNALIAEEKNGSSSSSANFFSSLGSPSTSTNTTDNNNDSTNNTISLLDYKMAEGYGSLTERIRSIRARHNKFVSREYSPEHKKTLDILNESNNMAKKLLNEINSSIHPSNDGE